MTELLATLDQLENVQLVHRADDLQYMFKHALTQDAAYQSLLQKQRRVIHTHIAQAYQEIYAHRCLDEFAAILAQHYAEAGDNAKTIEYATLAGGVAARTYANAEAILFYTLAIESGKQLATFSSASICALYLKRGRVYELDGQHDRALTNYAELEALAREHNDRPMELAALIARATIYSIPSPHFDVAYAKQLCDQALTLARQLGDEPAQAKILWNMLLLNSRLGTNYGEAIGYGEQAITIARRLDLHEQLAYLLNDLSLPLIWTGETERGNAYNLEARQMWRDLNNLPMLADNLNYAAMGHTSLGEYSQAIAAGREALEISQRIGNQWGECFSQSWIGEAYRAIGLVDQAILTMENSIRLAAHSFQAPLAFTRADLASLYGDLGQVARGIELAQQAKTEGEKIAQVMLIYAAAQLAHLFLLDGKIASAENLIQETFRRLSSTDDASLFGTTIKLTQAELALAQRDYPHAIQVCDHLLRTQQARQLRQLVPDGLLLKGLAQKRSGQMDDAIATLSQARAEAEHVNSRWVLWRIFAALAEIEMQRDHLDQAQRLRAQAREVVAYIADHTPPEFRESFLNLPDVRNVMEN